MRRTYVYLKVSFRMRSWRFCGIVRVISLCWLRYVRRSFVGSETGLIDMKKDIVSCAKGTPVDPLNVLSIVTTGSGSLEDALATAGNVFNQRVDAFLDVERALLRGFPKV